VQFSSAQSQKLGVEQLQTLCAKFAALADIRTKMSSDQEKSGDANRTSLETGILVHDCEVDPSS